MFKIRKKKPKDYRDFVLPPPISSTILVTIHGDLFDIGCTLGRIAKALEVLAGMETEDEDPHGCNRQT